MPQFLYPARLLAVAGLCQSSPVFMFVVCAEVIASIAGAHEQQCSHQITWSSFNQSVFFVAVDVRGFFCVNDVAAPDVSYCSLCNVSPIRSSTCLESLPQLSRYFLHVQLCTQVVDGGCDRYRSLIIIHSPGNPQIEKIKKMFKKNYQNCKHYFYFN